MAKRKKSRQEAPSAPAEPAPQAQAPAAQGSNFFSALRHGFKAAGETAERYARLGINMADLERLRLKLKAAHAALGENVMRCWDAAPDIGVTADDASVKQAVKAISDLRRRLREIEVKLSQLKQDNR